MTRNPAFPAPSQSVSVDQLGLSKREYFASAALTALQNVYLKRVPDLQRQMQIFGVKNPEQALAKIAVMQADFLIEELTHPAPPKAQAIPVAKLTHRRGGGRS